MVGDRLRGAWSHFRQRPAAWLAVAVVVYAVLTFVLANLRLVEFDVTTWDFGIYQQALWSGSHGGPFYEAADFETGGFGSFLQVHSAFVLYLLAPAYRLDPSPELLFAVQSILVALAAVPLYLLTLDLTGSPRRGLIAAALFLVWAPTIAGSLYDFHIESFLPVELFTVALLYERRSYLGGLAVAVLAFGTMEFAPVLTFALAVFFGWPTTGQLGRLWTALTEGPRGWIAAVRSALGDRRLVASLVLAVSSVGAYYLLLELRTHFLASGFGYPAFPTSNSGYVIGATPSALGISLSNLPVDFLSKFEVWLLLYALVAFIPFLAPRTLVLALPVVVFGALSSNPNYISIGFQYGFLYAIPVFLGLAYGMRNLTPSTVPLAFARPGPPPDTARRRWRRLVRGPPVWAVGLVLVVGANLVIGPLDPMLHGANGFGSGYRFTYEVPPGYNDVAQVVGLIPAHATVVATDDLFPLVANSLIAYSFIWLGGDYQLQMPFSPAQLPDAVLVSQDRYYTVTPWLADLLGNTSWFEARGVAWSTPAGVVVLYLAHYSGPLNSFGPVPSQVQHFGPGPIGAASTGLTVPFAQSPYHTAIESEPLNEGLIFSGPWANLGPGAYVVTVGVRAWSSDPTTAPAANESVLYLNGDAFGSGEFLGRSVPFGTLSGGGWVNVTFAVNASDPLFNVVVRGYSACMFAVVAFGYLDIAPAD
ncbi:MAG: DUF2079 domain-containing protein [Thermoplasmata archaeon]|nr:DUF2079 domain-containing protein [Thermoplasmata archaeon]